MLKAGEVAETKMLLGIDFVKGVEGKLQVGE